MKHSKITFQIIKAFYKVYNELGYGFLEKVYENAMHLELVRMELECRRQFPIKVYYREYAVGEYFADLIVADKVIVEIKTTENIINAHEYQLLNYLKATKIKVGLLLNFGSTPGIRRKINSN